jgi:hypothetical protein
LPVYNTYPEIQGFYYHLPDAAIKNRVCPFGHWGRNSEHGKDEDASSVSGLLSICS